MKCSAHDCEKPADGVKTVKKPVGDSVSYVTQPKVKLSTFKTELSFCQEHLDDPPIFVE